MEWGERREGGREGHCPTPHTLCCPFPLFHLERWQARGNRGFGRAHFPSVCETERRPPPSVPPPREGVYSTHLAVGKGGKVDICSATGNGVFCLPPPPYYCHCLAAVVSEEEEGIFCLCLPPSPSEIASSRPRSPSPSLPYRAFACAFSPLPSFSSTRHKI